MYNTPYPHSTFRPYTVHTELPQSLIGQTFPNYRALCLAMNEPIEAGDSKILQLKKWHRFFTPVKLPNSNAIRIDPPKEETVIIAQEIISRERLQWHKELAPQILDELLNCMGGRGEIQTFPGMRHLLITPIDAFEMFGLCNGQFSSLSKDHETSLFKNINIPEVQEKLFLAWNKAFISTLDYLTGRRLIRYNHTWLVYPAEAIDSKFTLSDLRIATTDEHDFFALKIIRDLLLNFRLDGVVYHPMNERIVFRSRYKDAFYAEADRQLFEAKGIKIAWKTYDITYHSDGLDLISNYAIPQISRKEHKKNANNLSKIKATRILTSTEAPLINFIIPIEETKE